ncbi:MAG: MarR family transcriptional regulator [Desulfobacteraceae bacterium]|jgi:DNA-binding MarR family transcriptional regulator|nr:MarR family transcriptional regulator [Desulfobacteraceae bacterium]
MPNDELLKLDNQLCFALYACSRSLTRLYRPLLNKLGITYPQYLVLMVLWENKQQAVSELGEKLLLDSGTLTPLLKRMETNGLVERTRSMQDERKVFIKISKKGKALKEQALAIPEQMFCQSGLTVEEFVRVKGDLKDLLKKILKQQEIPDVDE